MRELVVGDPHCTAEELDDCHVLMQSVEAFALLNQVDRITFLGDLHNNFAVVNVRVLDFWRQWFKKLQADGFGDIVVIVGNHDMLGDGSPRPNALEVYEDLVRVVSEPYYDPLKRLYLPYYASPNLFMDAVKRHPHAKLIFCHQEFNGAKYDNGFYAPGGVEVESLGGKTVISGHIHTPQQVGSVWYPGAPRWRTLSDANSERTIWCISYTPKMEILFVQKKDIGAVCKRIWAAKFVEGEKQPDLGSFDKDEYRFHVAGSFEYVKRTEEELQQKYKRVCISTSVNIKSIGVRESDGVDIAFDKFIDGFEAKNGTPVPVLKKTAKQRVYET